MFKIVGLCNVELKPFGPVQLQFVAPVAMPVSVNILPEQSVVGKAVADTAEGMLFTVTDTELLNDP